MKKKVLAFILSVSVMVSGLSFGAFAVENNTEQQRFEYGQAIVKLFSGTAGFVFADDDDFTIEKCWKLNIDELSTDSEDTSYDTFLIKSDSLSTEQLIERMQALDEVEYAEPNYICSADSTVNDPKYSLQWGLKNNGTISGCKSGVDINVEALWNKGITGDDKYVVAVLDTGVDYNHEDLKDNMWHNPYKNQGLAGEYGYDFCNDDADPMDDYFHGTHCAGILGAVGNNKIGISGVAQNVSIMAVKFLNNKGSGSVSDAISAYEYLIKAKDLGVNLIAVNNSWGEQGETIMSKSFNNMVTKLGQKGVLSICSAGNNANDNDKYTYIPSGVDNDYIISVGNMKGDGTKGTKSNYGKTTVDVMAPGTNIFSTMPNNSYDYKTGTSMATPMIAGSVVLANQYFNDSLTPLEIRSKIIDAVNTSESSLVGKSVSNGFVDLSKLTEEETKTLSSISIDSLPNKLTYNVGDSLDKTGLEVTARYSDGTTEKVTGYSVSGFDSSTAGNKTVTVTYRGKKATFEVTVKDTGGGGEETLLSISIVSLPNKLTYNIGESLDTTGLEVVAKYKNGNAEKVTDYNISGFDSSTEGKKTVTVSYKGMTTTFEIEVVKKQESVNGWVNSNGKWQYFVNGSFLTDWQSNIPGWGGQYFYFDKATGYAKSAWASDIPGWEGQWFYFNPSNCVMMKGWVYDGGTRFFYLDDNTGVMKKGWQFLNWSGGANWFYFDDSGICLTNTTTPDGYYVDGNGVWR